MNIHDCAFQIQWNNLIPDSRVIRQFLRNCHPTLDATTNRCTTVDIVNREVNGLCCEDVRQLGTFPFDVDSVMLYGNFASGTIPCKKNSCLTSSV